MAEIEWTEEAKYWLQQIYDYIARQEISFRSLKWVACTIVMNVVPHDSSLSELHFCTRRTID